MRCANRFIIQTKRKELLAVTKPTIRIYYIAGWNAGHKLFSIFSLNIQYRTRIQGDIDHSAHARDSSILHECFVCGPDANKMPYKFRHVIFSHRKCLRILLLPHTIREKKESRKREEEGEWWRERCVCTQTQQSSHTKRAIVCCTMNLLLKFMKPDAVF